MLREGEYKKITSIAEERVMKIRSVTAIMVSLVAMVLFASGSSARGVTAEQLARAGFDCFNAGPNDWTHCLSFRHFGNPSVRVMVFTEDGEQFLGTELLLRGDIYAGQPCPQNGLDAWDFDDGIGYFACHHFDTG